MGRAMFGGLSGLVLMGFDAGLPMGLPPALPATFGGSVRHATLSERYGGTVGEKAEQVGSKTARRSGHDGSATRGYAGASVPPSRPFAGRVR